MKGAAVLSFISLFFFFQSDFPLVKLSSRLKKFRSNLLLIFLPQYITTVGSNFTHPVKV